MKAYLDSSAILRRLLEEQGSLDIIDSLKLGITSQITRLECLRTLDRLHLRSLIETEELVQLRNLTIKLMNKLEVITITESLLSVAETSFSVPLGSLDSIHLASSILWRKSNKEELTFITHDKELALAAKSQGFDILGI